MAIQRGVQNGASMMARHLRNGNFHQRSNLRPSSIIAGIHPRHYNRQDDEDQSSIDHRRYFHSTVTSERAAAIILSLGALSAASYGVATAVRAYNDYREQSAKEEAEAAEEAKRNPTKPEEDSAKETSGKETKENKGPRENIFQSWFGVGVGAKYYEGGFEDTMTRREAALILGVRESSSISRVKEAHRKLLILNHPDAGGSTYMAGKINEAKELLLKGRRG